MTSYSNEVIFMRSDRRKLLKGTAALMAASAVVGVGKMEAKDKNKDKDKDKDKPSKKVLYRDGKPEKTPLFSGAVSFGNLLFISGKGAHFPGDIAAHTKHVLDELEKELTFAGSSMEKVLKVNVYLSDIKDYAGMNEVFLGRFGAEPPVRTTIATGPGNVPGNSLVEIDCIAYI
jgi:2-iminobutanoate/2-iminopropanoate deaminase